MIKTNHSISATGFVLCNDINPNYENGMNYDPVVDTICRYFSSAAGAAIIITPPKLQINLEPGQIPVSIGRGGKTYAELNNLDTINLPIKRFRVNHTTQYFEDTITKQKFVPDNYQICKTTSPVVLIDDWIHTGSTLRHVSQFFKNISHVYAGIVSNGVKTTLPVTAGVCVDAPSNYRLSSLLEKVCSFDVALNIVKGNKERAQYLNSVALNYKRSGKLVG